MDSLLIFLLAIAAFLAPGMMLVGIATGWRRHHDHLMPGTPRSLRRAG